MQKTSVDSKILVLMIKGRMTNIHYDPGIDTNINQAKFYHLKLTVTALFLLTICVMHVLKSYQKETNLHYNKA